MNTKKKQLNRIRRHKRVRVKIMGTKERPRVAVFKSNQYIYAQVIDDKVGKTLMSISDYGGKKAKTKTKTKDKKSEVAFKMGELLAEKIKKEGITEVVFDRGGFKFHGRIKSVADGLIKGGVKV